FDPIHEVSLQDIPAPDQQPGLGFGTSLAPLGDLNGDGFADFAVGAGLFDQAATGGGCPAPPALCSDRGRVYIFQSNNTPAAAATAQAGRSIDIAATKSRVHKGQAFRLKGTLTSPVSPNSCQGSQNVTVDRAKPRGGFTPFANTLTDGGG